jgi:hypothetical protein
MKQLLILLLHLLPEVEQFCSFQIFSIGISSGMIQYDSM